MKPFIITVIILLALVVMLLTIGLAQAAKRGDMMQEAINAQHNLDIAEQKQDRK